MIQVYHFWVYTQKNQSQLITETPHNPCLLQQHSQYLSYGIMLGAHQLMNG
jgi:hypothetical protein